MADEKEIIPATTAETADEGTGSVNWEDMNETIPGGDDSEKVEAPEPDEETPPAAETGEETPAKEETKAPEQKPSEEPPPAPQTPVEPEQKQETPEELAKRQEDYRQWLDKERTTLTELYKLSEEDAEKVQTEPELVLPKLLANMHLNLQRTLLEGMQQVLPQVMGQTSAVQAREAEAKKVFYGEWPELAQHHAKVVEIGKMYRQLNPKATPDEAIQAIGLMAMQTLKIKQKEQKSTSREAPTKPAMPGSSGSRKAAVSAKTDNIFDDLLDD
jgi:hypothetical protein